MGQRPLQDLSRNRVVHSLPPGYAASESRRGMGSPAQKGIERGRGLQLLRVPQPGMVQRVSQQVRNR
jgi:hypothetical protein